ncbi:hypothetical protein L6164_005809 [Bauhinia variegata]|uniref:Uncharacterized protein n=1 Tax=Bauhinia variegata TaxID=167791 RepID=A0ACB9PXU2_BAUVA|nr:hypothetical protein L6164_005809 [Bauhinia variegata]
MQSIFYSTSTLSLSSLLDFVFYLQLQEPFCQQASPLIYGPMLPDGCYFRDSNITSHSTQSEVRGELLAYFQLFVAVLVVLVGTVASYGFASSRYEHSDIKSSHSIQSPSVQG